MINFAFGFNTNRVMYDALEDGGGGGAAKRSVAAQAATAAGGGANRYGPGLINKPATPATQGANAADAVIPDTGDGTGTGAGDGTGTGAGSGSGTGAGSGSGGTRATGSPTPKKTPGQAYDANTKLNITAPDTAAQLKQRQELSAALNPEIDPAHVDRVEYYDKQPMVDMMTQQIEAARQQYNNQIDNSMDTAARDLNRALSDAQAQFQTQQNQVAADEMNALDNAALYAEARGDRGGIGQAQYNSVQNTAAQNRLAVRQAQTKLATDTARQISDLRAQGEFERADKMLALTQQYLSELRQIEEYAVAHNLSVDQINTAISEWEQNMDMEAQQFATSTELSLAQLTGQFNNGMSTYQSRQATLENAASLALSLIQAGVKPNQLSPTQLNALAEYYGMNQSAINNFYKRTN